MLGRYRDPPSSRAFVLQVITIEWAQEVRLHKGRKSGFPPSSSLECLRYVLTTSVAYGHRYLRQFLTNVDVAFFKIIFE